MTNNPISALLPTSFGPSSKVWVYQCNRAFIEKEQVEINEQLFQFYSQWLSHGNEVNGWAKILYGQFIVVLANEDGHGVSGCSTDSMVRIIKSIERQYSVNLFDRLMITFLVKGKAEMLPINQIQYALEKGYITPETPLFNNSVSTKEELENNWLVPLNTSWLAKKLSLAAENQ